MKNRILIAAGSLLFSVLTAQTAGSALADTEVVPFPTQVASMVPGRDYQVTFAATQLVHLTSSQPPGYWAQYSRM